MTLKEKLEAYTGMMPETMLVAVNADTVATSRRQVVPLWKIKKYCIESGAWINLKIAAAQTQNLTLAYVAQITMEYINDPRFENLDLDLESTKTLIAGLVAGDVLTEAQVTEIDAMADVKISYAVQLLGRLAELSDIIDALKMETI